MSVELFNLLPAVYRIRDAQIAASQGLSQGPLESLLLLIQEQIAIMANDLDQLYDDQFIETCAKWVIPYIGDLIGYQSVNGIAPSVDDPRSEVAETISLRRRKGTVLVMEQLARDVTAWGAHAVEFFRVLGDTQYMAHIRLYNYYSPDLRRWQSGLYIDTGFDETAHKVDVRNVSTAHGRYNIQNIGIFLWSLTAYSITNAPPASTVDPLCFRFNPLGMDMPLFHRAVSQGEQITNPATPVNVADRLRRRVLCSDLQQGVGAAYYGPTNSLALYTSNSLTGPFSLVNPYQIRVADLSGTDGSWLNRETDSSSPYLISVDPELGRLAITPPAPGSSAPYVQVSYYYGFNADMGGGSYSRANTFVVQNEKWVFPYPDTQSTPRYTSLQGALDFAVTELASNGQVAIEIQDNNTYTENLTSSVAVPAGTTLEFRAADGFRPVVLLEGELSITGAASSTFILNGLLIAGAPSMAPASGGPVALVHVPSGSNNALGELTIQHCTFVPGWSVDAQGNPKFPNAPNLVVEPSDLQVQIEQSIVGAIQSGEFTTICACDSIIDATDRTEIAYVALNGKSGGGPLTLCGCTVVGKVHATLLTLVSNSIFWGALVENDTWPTALISDRQQQGCVRFSFLPINAMTPRQYECVAQSLGAPTPIFFALRYGHPGYCKLLSATPDTIRRGADDGGEMGAFHFVLGPLREADLRIRMQEYLPVGLQFGIIYQN